MLKEEESGEGRRGKVEEDKEAFITFLEEEEEEEEREGERRGEVEEEDEEEFLHHP